MNIHKYQKFISDLVLETTRNSQGVNKNKKVKGHLPGCYIISRTLNYNLFKLGEAHGLGGLYQRILGQYKICMSLQSEFFLRYLVIAHRRKEGTKHYAQILEKALLTTIDSKVEDSYSNEYIFTPDISELETRMGRVLKSHQKYYSIAIKFTKNGFRLYEEGRGFNTTLLDFEQLPNLNPDVGLLLNLSKPEVKKKTLQKIPTWGYKKKNKLF
jgi:hypothetical protein